MHYNVSGIHQHPITMLVAFDPYSLEANAPKVPA